MISSKIRRMNTHAFIDSQNLNLGVRSQGWKLEKLDEHKKKIKISVRSKP